MSTCTVYRAISDPSRRTILDLLRDAGEMAAKALQEHFSFSQPALSKHLRLLREASLVQVRQEGRQRLYRLDATKLAEVHDWVAHYEAFWTGALDRLGGVLEELDAEGTKASRKSGPGKRRKHP